MGKGDDASTTLGGSAFWILMLLVSLVGLVFLAIWSFHNNSVKGIAISFVFFAMIVSGVIFSKFEIFNSGTWGQNTLSFSLGLIIWLVLGSFAGSQSVLSVSQNYLFSSIASELPQFLEMVMNNFVIPIAEETLWMIGIPFAVVAIMKIASRWSVLSFLDNVWVQMFVIMLVTGVTFALFHVGKYLLVFLIAAFIFRAIMVFSVIGDQTIDWIPGIALVPAFAVGAHIGNNWADYGFTKGVSLLVTNQAIGFIILLLLVVLLLSAINEVVLLIGGNGAKQ